MVLLSLTCAVVGETGGAFDVKIDDSEKGSALKEVIKKNSDGVITAPAMKLQLFLAKTADGAWLDGAGAAAVTLDGDGHLQGFEQMDPTLFINNDKHFGKNFGPAEGEVHVLVVVPKIESKRPAEDERMVRF
ncbi:Crinkler effector protein 4 [Phytophthora oleae]|uniref:Crinkler effector protein 4 n=1 Tax=Phytophthora oleae TaxID=2107226 RepID=A0ABD3FFQ8_9STRA